MSSGAWSLSILLRWDSRVPISRRRDILDFRWLPRKRPGRPEALQGGILFVKTKASADLSLPSPSDKTCLLYSSTGCSIGFVKSRKHDYQTLFHEDR